MPAYKDKAKGTWYASFYFENWTGKKEKKMKRGFKTKREALEWERTFLQQQTADLDMTFESFVALYAADVKGRIKENTWGTKEHILYKKLVPYFGKRKMSEISSKEVMAWQSEMLNYRDKNGKPYSPVYLKTLHNQLSAVFNHAVKHSKLKANPAAVAVLSGGQGEGEDISEAECMGRYLKSKGVNEGRMLLEDRSTSTLENLTFSKQAIEQAGGDPSRVAIVSSSYHLYRACRMASALGMEAEGLRSADGCPVYMTGMYLREALAVWKLWVSDIYMRPLGGIRFFFLPSP